ncbi:MAG: hypothetical protein GYB65_03475 [Chloroflexi bacterium]|nr:hypothetical protein [Chloroflexota bacterium]
MKHLMLVCVVSLVLVSSTGVFAQGGDGYPPITPENVADLELVDILGKGPLIDVQVIDDGATLAALSTGGITLYDTAAIYAPPRYIRFEENYFGPGRGAIGIAPEAAVLYRDGQATVFAWEQPYAPTTRIEVDLATGTQTVTQLSRRGAVAFSEDGRWMVAYSPFGAAREMAMTVDVIDTLSGESYTLIEPVEEAALVDLGFVADDSLLVTVALYPDPAEVRTIEVWDLATGELVNEMTSPSYRVLVGGTYVLERLGLDGGFVLRDAVTLEQVAVPDQFAEEPVAAVGPYLVLAGRVPMADEQLVFWDVAAGAEAFRIPRRESVCTQQFPIDFAIGEDTIYAYESTSIVAIRLDPDRSTGWVQAQFGNYGANVTDMEFVGSQLLVSQSDNRIFTCDYRVHGVATFDLESGDLVDWLPTSSLVTQLAVSPSGALALYGPSAVEQYAPDRQSVVRYADERFDVDAFGMTYSDDERYLGVQSMWRVFLWDLADPNTGPALLSEESYRLGDNSNLGFFGSWFVFIADDAVQVYDVEQGTVVHKLTFDQQPWALDLNPVTGLLVVLEGEDDLSEQQLHVFDLANGFAPVNSFALPAPDFETLAVNPDGSLVVLAREGTWEESYPRVLVLDLASGEELFVAHDVSVDGGPLAFSPDGTRLVISYGTAVAVYTVPE